MAFYFLLILNDGKVSNHYKVKPYEGGVVIKYYSDNVNYQSNNVNRNSIIRETVKN